MGFAITPGGKSAEERHGTKFSDKSEIIVFPGVFNRLMVSGLQHWPAFFYRVVVFAVFVFSSPFAMANIWETKCSVDEIKRVLKADRVEPRKEVWLLPKSRERIYIEILKPGYSRSTKGEFFKNIPLIFEETDSSFWYKSVVTGYIRCIGDRIVWLTMESSEETGHPDIGVGLIKEKIIPKYRDGSKSSTLCAKSFHAERHIFFAPSRKGRKCYFRDPFKVYFGDKFVLLVRHTFDMGRSSATNHWEIEIASRHLVDRYANRLIPAIKREKAKRNKKKSDDIDKASQISDQF